MRITKAVPNIPTLATMKRDMDTLVDRVLGGPLFPEPFFAPIAPMAPPMTGWVPVLDFAENPTEFIVRLEVPGVHKENLDINLTGNVLTITGRRENIAENKGETYLWQEREIGTFTRTLRLPVPVNEAAVVADYADGILTIHLPKANPVPANKILIK